MKNTHKKGISPVVATVLLIVIALAAFAFVFMFARGFIKESIEKFNAPIENACQSIVYEATLSEGEGKIYLNNQGNTPVYGFNIEQTTEGSSTVTFVRPQSGNLAIGAIDVLVDIWDLSGVESVKIIPVLVGLGKNTNEGRLFPCTDYAKTLK